jgi:hypothetical protein
MATQASKLNFDIKAVGVILLLAGMWYDLKTDLAIYKEKHNALEFRVDKLENKNMAAVLPKEVNIESERYKHEEN